MFDAQRARAVDAPALDAASDIHRDTRYVERRGRVSDARVGREHEISSRDERERIANARRTHELAAAVPRDAFAFLDLARRADDAKDAARVARAEMTHHRDVILRGPRSRRCAGRDVD